MTATHALTVTKLGQVVGDRGCGGSAVPVRPTDGACDMPESDIRARRKPNEDVVRDQTWGRPHCRQQEAAEAGKGARRRDDRDGAKSVRQVRRNDATDK